MTRDQGNPIATAQWRRFLQRRGLSLAELQVERLDGVTNDTWKLTPPGPEENGFVLRHYRRTRGHDAITFELGAVRYLAEQGFPVADVIHACDGTGFDEVQGRPGALFRYVPGVVGASPDRAGCADLAGGRTAARLLARMHHTTRGRSFGGAPSERSTPIERLERWVDDVGGDPEFVDVPGGPAFLSQVNRFLDHLNRSVEQRSDLWSGLVHGDVAPNNIVLDESGDVAALIDFDDCMDTFVLYDLTSILWYWGRSGGGDLDPSRVWTLVDAYDQTREVTKDERVLVQPLLAAFLAADAIGKITWWWRGARRPRAIADIHTARAFLDLSDHIGWSQMSC